MRFAAFARASAALSITIAGLAAALPAAAQSRPSVWRNPSNSVHVRTEPCGAAMCGVVVWASEKAIADARRGGTPALVGTRLFRDFRKTGPNDWEGKVFIPDLGVTLSGTLTLVGRDQMVGKGCVARNLGCRSQTWTRIGN